MNFYYKASEITAICQGKYVGPDRNVALIVTDSRAPMKPGESLFAAIKGKTHDGHRYIPELIRRGINIFLVEDLTLKSDNEITIIYVDNTLKALQKLAAFHRERFHYPVAGITGSNGKTIVKEWLYQLLTPKRKVVRSPKSYNSQIGVPLSIYHLSSAYDFALIEAGISQPEEMANLGEIIKPTVGIITNIGEAHQENFSNYVQKANEKLRLFKNSTTIIYSLDDEVISQVISNEQGFTGKQFYTWSTTFPGATVYLEDRIITPGRTTLKIRVKEKEISAHIPFSDAASLANALTCFTTLIALGEDPELTAEKLQYLEPVAMRLELKKGIQNCTLINDTYNSDVVSLGIALDYLSRQNQHTRKTVILSDILQSGIHPHDLYKKVADLMVVKNVDYLIGIGAEIYETMGRIKLKADFYPDTDTFIAQHPTKNFNNEAILIKGARKFEFEKIVSHLEQKVHQTRLEINLTNLAYNLNFYRSLLQPGVRTMVMVKAFAYGSGSVEIATVLQHQKVDYLAVAFADEGVELRKAGIHLPIMVMNPEKGSFEQMISHNLEPELYSLRIFKEWIKIITKSGKPDYPVHIKIESGMHRLGFEADECDTLIRLLNENPHIRVVSVFSHLSSAGNAHHDDFSNTQIEQFRTSGKKIIKSIKEKPLLHILNTSGIERFPHAQFDMVRLGIGLHGISNTYQDEIKPVASFKSIISQVKQIKKGEFVSYNKSYHAKKSTTIGIVPVGYADGLCRKLGNGRATVKTEGHKAPIIGDICMDMSMIELSDPKSVKEGQEVIIFDEPKTLQKLADLAGTIPYELLTSISARVKRIYIEE